MSQELEAKFYIGDLDALRTRMEGLGAELARPRTLETNLRFDTPDEQLDAGKRLLRLRKDNGIRLTYKEPDIIVGGASQRLELEVTVSDFDTLSEILKKLGYVVTVVYEKYRAEYHLDGLYITLDEMPFGNFIEIEGGRVEDIQAVAKKLGLDWSANIPQNYLILFNRLKAHHPIDFRDMTFENFTGMEVSAEDLGVVAADLSF